MGQFGVFVGIWAPSAAPTKLCDDIECRNFREARQKALNLYKEKAGRDGGLFACVTCADLNLFIGSGIRAASVRNFGNGYCVDVTPSPPAEPGASN